MPTLDVFNSDAFSVRSMTAAILKAPYRPGRIGELGLFDAAGITTTTVQIEEMSGRLSLIATSPRGAPAPDPLGASKRTLRSFAVPHLTRETKVYADEIQNIRAFGSETEVQVLETLVGQRLATLRAMHEVTLEFHRMGAIQGLILDADGATTLFNLFTEFAVAQQTQDFNFSTATLDVRNVCVAAARKVEAELGAAPYTGLRAFCSSNFFDTLVGHANVKEAFKYQEGQMLRTDLRGGFVFGGITWEEYRGAVNKPDEGSSVDFVAQDIAFLVPEGVLTEQGPLFQTRYAPADFEDTVNTLGLPLYARNSPDPEYPAGQGRFRKLHSQSNPLCLCLRPRSVIKLTKS